jgi:hypothetical protein
MSLVEAVANVVVGYAVAVLTQIIVFPLFDLEVTLGENLGIGGLFTLASLCRSFVLRRVFEAIRVHGARTIAAGHVARRLSLWCRGRGSLQIPCAGRTNGRSRQA